MPRSGVSVVATHIGAPNNDEPLEGASRSAQIGGAFALP
jgi:hypothetical protein